MISEEMFRNRVRFGYVVGGLVNWSLFLENLENFSGPKSQLSLFWKADLLTCFACKKSSMIENLSDAKI